MRVYQASFEIPLAQEQITVTTAVGITSSLFDSAVSGVPRNVTRAVFEHVSGDKIWHNAGLAGDPSADGTDGAISESVGNKWEIADLESLKNWRAIVDSGGVTADVNLTLFGKP